MKVTLTFPAALEARIAEMFPSEGREERMALAVLSVLGKREIEVFTQGAHDAFQVRLRDEAAKIDRELGLDVQDVPGRDHPRGRDVRP